MEKKEENDKKAKELSYAKKLQFANAKSEYIDNVVNSRYYLARYNMLAEQIQKKVILEKIDGLTKSFEYAFAEMGLMKVQAIKSSRNTFFGRKELMEKWGLTDEDVKAVELDYYDGKILREDYDEDYKKGSKAEFVNSSED